MTILDKLKDSYNHMYWADAKIWETVLSIPQAENHDKLKKLLFHLHLTQNAFYRIWSDLPMEFPKQAEFKSLTELAQWAFNNIELLQSFITKLNEEDLDKIINIPWVKHSEKHLGVKAADINLAETMFQVIDHSTYHRGQANSLIRLLESAPPQVDYIIWVWLGKPEAEWPNSIVK
jgi:uncharacterized damage-inducible protein DinB